MTDAAWSEVTACVVDLFARFDVDIVDRDPGDVPHVEAVFTDRAARLGRAAPSVAGLAPYAGCTPVEHGIAFTFVEHLAGDLRSICETQAQELAHLFGVDHLLLLTDVMSYLPREGPRAFQDVAARCGEDAPRPCGVAGRTCGETQSSVRVLAERLGVRAPLDGTPDTTGGCASACPMLLLGPCLARGRRRRRGV